MLDEYSKITDIMNRARKNEIFPGAFLLFARGGKLEYEKAFGHASLFPEVFELKEDTLFDIASLTKVMATTTAIILLIRDGYLEIDDRASKFIPSLNKYGKGDITIRHLLSHSSGFPAWKPYYEKACDNEGIIPDQTTRNFVFEMVHKEELIYPVGTDSKYSDLGFILLGEIIEGLTENSLEDFCKEQIFNPLNMKDTFYLRLPREKNSEKERFAATENCPWRKRMLRGEVHDANAYAMQGIAGHAGLFATGKDVYLFAREILKSLKGESKLIPKEMMEEFSRRQGIVRNSSRALGWDTPSRIFSTSGKYFSKNSIGHTGFTGVSLWIDLKREIIIVLLSNRVHPSRENEVFNRFRPYIHDEVMKELLKDEK